MSTEVLRAPPDPYHLGHRPHAADAPPQSTGHGGGGPAPKRIVVGYGFWIFLLSDVIMFASFFAAAWKLEGAGAFLGISEKPTLTTFIYFSLLMATTVGSEIVPHSLLTRALAGLESIVALTWTLVVFAAISVQFADAARASPTQPDPSTQKEERDPE